LNALSNVAEFADRLAYSYRFAALTNTGTNGRPVLTKAQWVYLAKAAGLNVEPAQQWHDWHSGERGGDPAGLMNPMVLRMRANSFRSQPSTTSTDPFDDVLGRTQREVLLELARSEIGLLFLDRTRLRPDGFVVGEHIHTIGLAAGEEAVLEQKSFYQRESSTEQTFEKEQNDESEINTSWSLDVTDVIVGNLSSSRTDGFGAGGSVGFDYGVKVGVDAKLSDTATDADSTTRTGTTKEVNANTTKNAAKMREFHKTVVRVSSTDRFEQSARRTIRNPNAYTPIDLHMFKILRRIRFSHERFGVRLCWTPFVKDPAGQFFAAEETMRQSLLKRANDSVPPVTLPPQPVITSVPNAMVIGLDPPMTELAVWGGWPGSDMSHDYTLPINVPANMKWDEDAAFLKGSLRVTLTGQPRTFGFECVGDPWIAVNASGDQTIFQVVHVGAGWRLTGSSQLWVSLSARVIPNTTSLAQEAQTALNAWEAACKALQAERAAKVAVAEQQALAEFIVWRNEHRATLNAPRELLRRFITTMFTPDSRDEIAELDVWDQVFDWEMASARLYSGTWNGEGYLRDPSLGSENFVNASWARLFLPVRPGYEDTALRWIFLQSRTQAGPGSIENLIASVDKQIADWRQANLGGPEEISVVPVTGQVCPDVIQKYICLGTWKDYLPTDGVHMEVTQTPTTAADARNEARADREVERMAAIVAATVADGQVRETLAKANLGSVDSHIHLHDTQG
jgi:hypothetical protein